MALSDRPRLLLDTDAMYQLSNPTHQASDIIVRAVTDGEWDLVICQPVLREFLRLVSRKRNPLARLMPILGIVMVGSSKAMDYAGWEPTRAEVEAARGAIPDDGDLPVWLAAKRCRAAAIITYNTKDYAGQTDVAATTPEAWLADHP